MECINKNRALASLLVTAIVFMKIHGHAGILATAIYEFIILFSSYIYATVTTAAYSRYRKTGIVLMIAATLNLRGAEYIVQGLALKMAKQGISGTAFNAAVIALIVLSYVFTTMITGWCTYLIEQLLGKTMKRSCV